MASFEEVLSELGNRVDLHARLINTFSLLEYIGARKIIKSQIDRNMSLDLLNHVAEEIRHAQILKHLALKLSHEKFDTYGEDHLIAGRESRTYIQTIDRAVEAALDQSRSKDEWANYLITTLLIEERALKVYPIYDKHLSQLEASGKFSSIIRDEDKHLQCVLQSVKEKLKPGYPQIDIILNRLYEIEARCFGEFMTAILKIAQAR